MDTDALNGAEEGMLSVRPGGKLASANHLPSRGAASLGITWGTAGAQPSSPGTPEPFGIHLSLEPELLGGGVSESAHTSL